MSRTRRVISESGLYHIVFRGLNRQHIFEETKDYELMYEILKALKEEMKFEIYAYCFMSNHVHIIIKEAENGEISLIMKRLLTKYVMKYNIKYQRTGSLIGNRYKSKPVEIDEYFMHLIRYIHQNPIKAQLANSLEEYKWSSYNEYINKEKTDIVDTDFVLNITTPEDFIEFHKEEEAYIFIVENKSTVNDDEIRRLILKKYKIEPKEMCSLDKKSRDEMLAELRKNFSIRQLERVTGISRGIIAKS